MCDEHQHHSSRKNDVAEARRYGKAFAITLMVLVGQIAVVLYSKSLTLLADSVHVGSDLTVILGSLLVVLFVQKLSLSSEERVRRWFGYIGITLLVFGAFYVLTEAYERLSNPTFDPNIWVVIIAIIGGLGNLWVHMMLHKVPKEEHNHTHNVLSAHVLSDLMLSIVVVIAWTLTLVFDWVMADPILSVAVAGYMFFLSGRLFEKIQSGQTIEC